jgi:hypothetical protein
MQEKVFSSWEVFELPVTVLFKILLSIIKSCYSPIFILYHILDSHGISEVLLKSWTFRELKEESKAILPEKTHGVAYNKVQSHTLLHWTVYFGSGNKLATTI